MAKTNQSYSRSESTKTTRQYWLRNKAPKPWWPWGLLPALGLVGLFLFGALVTAPNIQAEVRGQVADRLNDVGVSGLKVSANGQRVSAWVGDSTQEDQYLHALAKSTTCDTWAGELTCPSLVDIDRDTADAVTQKIEYRPHRFNVVRGDGAVTLQGEVPSIAERDRLLGVAGEYFGQVNDELSISNEAATPRFAPAADRALAVVNQLDSGEASWSGELLSVSGVTSAGNLVAVRDRFSAPGGSGMLGEFDVQVLEQEVSGDSQRCNDAFGEILTNATIRFRTNSAAIDDGNDALLERLANVASGCPGHLVIAGHTDSRGDADMNRALSLARAEAVRDALAMRGVDRNRVAAQGFGEAEPIADNASAEGRARNRRIAIAVNSSN